MEVYVVLLLYLQSCSIIYLFIYLFIKPFRGHQDIQEQYVRLRSDKR